jgi:hypothetical protein
MRMGIVVTQGQQPPFSSQLLNVTGTEQAAAIQGLRPL